MKRPLQLIALTFLCCCLYFSTSVLFASGKHPTPSASFEGSPGWSKIDLRSREAWRQAIDGGDRKAKLECLMKLTHTATDNDKAALAAAGFEARTFIGAILTGSVAAGRLPDVANLDIVQAMELATPLSIKKE